MWCKSLPVLALAALLSTTTATQAQSLWSSRNVFGGYDLHLPGGGTITSMPNVFGGYNYWR